ncbi:Flp family type IVb pilin [Arthrobacter sp. Marseille-P9274]|uniref:Flp family type IVb pilin n=1 Tax=Arthrobacter sp. Marseille-P9274 TaxID=2866572 RepID=UPI0021C8D4D7|nr:Flp family type IVb pilin [Arthrobacter sp. Marseille-P9274]
MLGLYMNVRNFVTSRLAREEKGATAVEYGIMVALIAVAIIAAVTLLGGTVTQKFSEAQCAISGKTYSAATVAGEGGATVTAAAKCA